MRFNEFFYIPKSDRDIIKVTLIVGIIAVVGINVIGHYYNPDTSLASDSVQVSDSPKPQRQYNRKQQYYATEPVHAERFAFDPNTADSTQLLRLGLQPWQVRNIYKYRAHGGVYRTPEDFAQTYGLTLKLYRELEPYIQISPDYRPAADVVKRRNVHFTADNPSSAADTLRRNHKLKEGETIDLATADTLLLQRVPGIGAYYSRAILRYGKQLGGYVSVNQLDEIEGFPAEAKVFFRIDKAEVQQLNVNKLTLAELRRHPYINYYQAKEIVEYRRTNGPITNIDQLRLLSDFPEDVIRRLRPYICY